MLWVKGLLGVLLNGVTSKREVGDGLLCTYVNGESSPVTDFLGTLSLAVNGDFDVGFGLGDDVFGFETGAVGDVDLEAALAFAEREGVGSCEEGEEEGCGGWGVKSVSVGLSERGRGL